MPDTLGYPPPRQSQSTNIIPQSRQHLNHCAIRTLGCSPSFILSLIGDGINHFSFNYLSSFIHDKMSNHTQLPTWVKITGQHSILGCYQLHNYVCIMKFENKKSFSNLRIPKSWLLKTSLQFVVDLRSFAFSFFFFNLSFHLTSFLWLNSVYFSSHLVMFQSNLALNKGETSSTWDSKMCSLPHLSYTF